jgi:hypothetical protein
MGRLGNISTVAVDRVGDETRTRRFNDSSMWMRRERALAKNAAGTGQVNSRRLPNTSTSQVEF